MKKLIYLLSLTFVLSACSDFLNEDNKGGITSDEFYSTADGFETLVTATYSSLRTMFGSQPWLLVAGTDMYQISRRDDNHGIQRYDVLEANNGSVRDFYQRAYAGIQVANTGLFYADKGPDMNPATLSIRRAELRFLRAFYHFLLLEQFGGVAINDVMTDAPRVNMPRASLSDTYDFIITEMEAIINDLPAAASPKGRIDQRVVRHYLAKVYLTRAYDLNSQADFTKARDYAEAAIASQAITIPFETLWSPANQNNAEVIFAVQYDLNSMPNPETSGNMQQALFGPYLGGPERGHKYSDTNFFPTWYLHSLYDEDDARYDATFMRKVYQRYFYYYERTADQLANTPIDWYYPRKWNGAWTEADTEAWRNEDPANRANTTIYPFPVNEGDWMVTINFDGAYPIIKKFDDPSNQRWSTSASSRDIVLARLAETYFIAAEAYLGLSQPQLAADKINAVRNRPGNSKSGGSLPEITSAEMTLNRLLQESAKEFAGEYLRWPELRRTKKLIELCVAHNPNIRPIGESAFRGLDGQNKIYRPIPEDAIILNPGLTQNPGYSSGN